MLCENGLGLCDSCQRSGMSQAEEDEEDYCETMILQGSLAAAAKARRCC